MILVRKENKGQLDHKDLLEKLDQKEIKETLALLDHLGPMDKMDQKEIRVIKGQ